MKRYEPDAVIKLYEKEAHMRTNVPKLIAACAQAAHEANRAYCEAIGDNSQFVWSEASDDQIASALVGVHGVLVDKNTPEASHESWLVEKERQGWIYGPVKDVDQKEHPCMVPYAELPEEQKQKDEIFVTVVQVVAKALGWTSAEG